MPAITLAISEVEKMTINSKQNCISDLCASILRTASWRRALQAKYINDPRNGRAAETLSRLADEAVNLSDEQWADPAQELFSRRTHPREHSSPQRRGYLNVSSFRLQPVLPTEY
jgi:hypothetical protein